MFLSKEKKEMMDLCHSFEILKNKVIESNEETQRTIILQREEIEKLNKIINELKRKLEFS